MSDASTTPPAASPRRRGRVAPRWVFRPWLLAWALAWGVMWWVGQPRSPELAPFVFALYGCLLFFGHAYQVAWRTGAWLWRSLAWIVVIAIHAGLAWWHADDASARVIYVDGLMEPRGAEPRMFIAVALHGAGALLLTLHVFFLGLGSRDADEGDTELQRPTALTVPVPADRLRSRRS